MAEYTKEEKDLAEAMTEEMTQKDRWQVAYEDNLKTLHDMLESEYNEFLEAYAGDALIIKAIKLIAKDNKKYNNCQVCGSFIDNCKHL